MLGPFAFALAGLVAHASALPVAPAAVSPAPEQAPAAREATLTVPASFLSDVGAAQGIRFGHAAAKLVLFPGAQVTRPVDLPPLKGIKGFGLAFDW